MMKISDDTGDTPVSHTHTEQVEANEKNDTQIRYQKRHFIPKHHKYWT